MWERCRGWHQGYSMRQWLHAMPSHTMLSYWQRIQSASKFGQFLGVQIMQKKQIARSQQHDNVNTFLFDFSKTCLRQHSSVLLLPSFRDVKMIIRRCQNDITSRSRGNLAVSHFAIMQALTIRAKWGKIVQRNVSSRCVSEYFRPWRMHGCRNTIFHRKSFFDRRPSIMKDKHEYLLHVIIMHMG